MIKKIVMVLCLCLMCTMTTFANPKMEDFSYKGLYLGDSYERMVQLLGTPRYDMEQLVQGVMVTYYIYPKDTKVALDNRNKKVVDIQVKDKDYATDDGVKIGATPYKMKQVYGKAEKKFMEGKAYYIYENPNMKNQRLLLQVESTEGYLESFELTSLPLADEAVAIENDEDTGSETNDVNAAYINSKEIDMSAIQAKS
jgi:hypothetical protein